MVLFDLIFTPHYKAAVSPAEPVIPAATHQEPSSLRPIESDDVRASVEVPNLSKPHVGVQAVSVDEEYVILSPMYQWGGKIQ